MKTFQQVLEQHLPTLKQYVPIVERVHGGSHPEFHQVREVFEAIVAKVNEAGAAKPHLDEELAKLREITNQYTVPNDVCESYEAVYNLLNEMDQAYRLHE